jgi:hypothetical protein
MAKTPPYHEHLLHWLWQRRYLQNEDLVTTDGAKVQIYHPGYPNRSDGPDFLNARIKMDALQWHGDVEIHWQPDDWFNHEHHTNPAFNRVILHVVFDDSKSVKARRQDDTTIAALCMKPFLKKPLQYFFQQYQRSGQLPCSGSLASIPENVITKQFNEAHRAYFEQKVDDLLQFYDSSLPPSEAWKRTLIIALFDGLGISHNREPMQKLAKKLLEEDLNDYSTNDLQKFALAAAGIQPENPKSSFQWNYKGSRPANHPENRIRQGCYMVKFISNKPFKWWLQTAIKDSFSKMMNEIDTSPKIGKHQADVLLGAIWIPACYLLGELTGANRIMSAAANVWSSHRTKLPHSIVKYFIQSEMQPAAYQKKLGAVHQYRAYCKPRQCQQCRIFQHLISS